MDSSTSVSNKNLLIGILLPVIFLAILYSFYRIDLYFATKFYENIPKTEIKKGVSEYKLLYSIKSADSFIESSLATETIPRGTLDYNGTDLYNENATHLTVHEECVLNNNKLEKNINYISEDEVEGFYSEYLNVKHVQETQLYAYDFKNKRPIKIDCNPNYTFTDVKYTDVNELAESPDGFINFKYSEKQTPEVIDEGFPYLRESLRQPTPMWINPYQSRKILINGELIDSSTLIFDNVGYKSYDQLMIDANLKVFGWVK
jgi:hypothetical protein